jgi:6-phosphogluconolactonase
VKLQHLDDVAAGATAVIAGRIREGTRGGREFTMALSGGRTPWTILDNLARLDDLAWRQVQIYQVDERLAPAGDPDRNLTHVEAHLASQVPVVVHPLPVDDRDPEVTQCWFAVVREQNIVWLDVAVKHTCIVGHLQS